ncbi:MAG: glycosyltransferase family 2 protein [Anaerostipes sp.]|jgi:glycosyltransferase involved in cell wall biosynthesis|nr:glycosyltransferase family 2 protein [Anaerostipes sp.]MDD3745928.1 glycosyltransferase family 2 protein [Anaerostipes sp.]
MDRVSIIVPVYNVEKYLKKCISSIINQTYINWELLLIDDGSTDNSGLICDEFVERDQRIQVYHMKNHGVAAARNKGLEIAKGKYVFFIDSDDYIDSKYLEHFLMNSSADFLCSGYQNRRDEDSESKISVNRYEPLKISVSEYKKNYMKYKIMRNFVPMVRFKMNIIQKSKIRFDENVKLGEDVRFNLKYLNNCKEIEVTSYTDYVYWYHQSSATGRFFENRIEKEREECMLTEEFFGETTGENFFRYYCWHAAIGHYERILREKPECKKKVKRLLKQTYNDIYFRQSMKYMWKQGTKDMKIEAICIYFHVPNLCSVILNIIGKIKKQ